MPPDSQREAVLFQAAVQFTGDDRRSFLDNACRDDPALRARLEALLAAHEQSQGVLAEAGVAVKATIKIDLAEAPDETIGQKIGRYKILERIGEGGCGTVYVVEQTEPVRRRVALKVIKLGMDTKQVVARFEAERQALAMMDHPNIAKVLDAGSSEAGRPYFVMELVRGIRITDYCDQNKLSTKGRLDLFTQVCHAVQHAHQKGVIHRDIKPSNILVTLHDSVPVPKVIDFGIAKATEGRLTDATVYTQLHQFIGTPAYMSPEQAEMSGLDIDTRSDIYSLGVLLYELLTGKTPLDAKELMSLGLDAMRKTIREKEPPRPSTKLATLQGEELSTAALRRSSEAPRLISELRGDLDWIVMKCLEKDRTRRYETANGLAAELKRYLNNEAVTARPPSKIYELQKTMRRHKVGVTAAALVMVVLTAGVVVTTEEAARARHEARRATAALDQLRATAPAFAEQAHSLAAKECFGEAIEKLDYAIQLRPDVADYLVAKGDLLQCQFKLAQAVAAYRQALRLSPRLTSAKESADLCEQLLAAPLNDQGKLTRESLAKLYLAMQRQQRSAAELMPVARLLGEQNKLLQDYWLERLKDLPVSSERPLKQRLTIREDGRLGLDLSGTKVVDLSPLDDAPLDELNVAGSADLHDLSPLRLLHLTSLNIQGTGVADLSPLREMSSLKKLDISNTQVMNLSALAALRLTNFSLSGCAINDLAQIRGMRLDEIDLSKTRVTDLSPLAGMPITTIDLSDTPVVDFSPLSQLPLKKCFFQRNRISDLAVLPRQQLTELSLWGCVDARDYAALNKIKTLEILLLPSEYRTLPDEDYAAIGALREHPKLRQIGAEIMDPMEYEAIGPKAIFWRDWDREQTFVPALRKSGIKFSLQKLANGSYALSIYGEPLLDLSILSRAPLSDLAVIACRVSDLAPLRNVPLESLNLSGNPVSDLSPLRGKQIRSLSLTSTQVEDLSPLTSLPLKNLYLGNCQNVSNLACLAQISTLEKVVVPPHAANIDALRNLPNLEKLSYQLASDNLPGTTAAEFWQEYDANPWIARLREAGVKARSIQRLDDGTWNVDLGNSKINDLSILRGAAISWLSLGSTPISDLKPLHGMPLKRLWIYNTAVADLSPLKGMALTEIHLAATQVSDLAVLRGMPLTSVKLHDCPGILDVSPLLDCKDLQTLTLPTSATNIEQLHALPRLERVSFTENPNDAYRPSMTAAEFWSNYDANPWITRLGQAGLKPQTLKRLDDGTWELNLCDSRIVDLGILRGASISRLLVGNTAVADLSPLRGMPLKTLWLYGTQVVDLSPLQGMDLTEIHLGDTMVTNISALRGMHLTVVKMHGCPEAVDVSPLADCQSLRTLTLPRKARNIERLRRLRNLERIGFKEDEYFRPDKTAREFWQDYDAE